MSPHFIPKIKDTQLGSHCSDTCLSLFQCCFVMFFRWTWQRKQWMFSFRICIHKSRTDNPYAKDRFRPRESRLLPWGQHYKVIVKVTWDQAQFERFSYILSNGYRWNWAFFSFRHARRNVINRAWSQVIVKGIGSIKWIMNGIAIIEFNSFTKELFDFLDVSSFMIRQVLRRSPRFYLNALSK